MNYCFVDVASSAIEEWFPDVASSALEDCFAGVS